MGLKGRFQYLLFGVLGFGKQCFDRPLRDRRVGATTPYTYRPTASGKMVPPSRTTSTQRAGFPLMTIPLLFEGLQPSIRDRIKRKRHEVKRPGLCGPPH